MNERSIFLSALEIADLSRRSQYLDEACGGDAALRSQVEELLRQHQPDSPFLEKPIADSAPIDQTIAHSGSQSGSEALSPVVADAIEGLLRFFQPATRPQWLGRLGHYEIEKILGAGAFGIVAKAFDEKLHRVVAIKFMNPELAATSPPRKRFLREARAAAAVHHPNIVGIHDVFEEPIPYLVMEYVGGPTLQQHLDETGPLDLAEFLRLAQQIAAGMAAAHAANLIHRDIKPSNILLEGGVENRPKISDFGLARAVDDASMTQSGMIAGTPLFMAPEQARGEPLDHRADLFSLGSVLYQMVSGRPPFRAANTMAVLKRVCEDTPRPITDVIPGTPDWLCAIIEKLLEKKPEDRYQSAKEVADLLARCQAELQLNGKVTIGTAGGTGSSGGKPNRGSFPRPPRWPVLFGVLLVLGVNLLGWMLQLDRTTVLVLNIVSMLIGALVGFRERVKYSQRIHDHLKVTSAPSPGRSNAVLTRVLSIVGAMTIGLLLVGFLEKIVSKRFEAKIVPLPKTEVAGGLRFDGKDDWVRVENVNWSYPQFTIEAFVTSRDDSDNGTIALLTSWGQKDNEWMSLFDGNPAPPGQRVSGAAITAKTPYRAAVGPFTAGERQHRALVFDGYAMHYYINGAWQAKRYASPHEGLMWNMNELRIGCDGGERRFFQGKIDQLRVSKVARYVNSFPPVTSVSSDAQTLALYNFDEGEGDVLKDASGNGHDGKIRGGAAWVARNNVKSSDRDVTTLLRFDGVDDYVEIPALNPPDGPMTIEVWAALDEQPNGVLVSMQQGRRNATLWHSDMLGMTQELTDGRQLAAHPQKTVGFGRQLRHLAGVWDGDKIQLFLDGIPLEVVQMANLEHWENTPPGTRLGGATGTLNGLPKSVFFRGDLAAARISGEARYRAAFKPSRNWTTDSKTLALYNFDQGEGDVLKDASGNGHDGKIVGATWVKGREGGVKPLLNSSALEFDGRLESHVSIPSLKLIRGEPVTLEGYFAPRGECYNRQEYQQFIGTPYHSLHVPPRGVGKWRWVWSFGRELGNGRDLRWCDGPKCVEQTSTHIACIHNSGELRIYFNGELAGSTQESHDSSMENDKFGEFKIGAGFIGVIDEVRISRIARYQRNFTPQPRFEVDKETIALYHFDEGDGDMLKDASGNGHDGKIMGATWVKAKSRNEAPSANAEAKKADPAG